MDIKLHKLVIENFKGIKRFDFDPDGENAVIEAENGVGKTSVYDAFLWLLFGKDSSGRKDFELRPLDDTGQPIKGLTLAVQATLVIEGESYTFRKEHTEKVVKNQLRGYETAHWIEEVPKKAGEYATYVTEIIPEDQFKLFTDLNYFNSKLHWTERRKVLLELAGQIGTPDGFDELTEELNGRTIEEYRKVLTERKKGHTKERDGINPRIDELQRGLDGYAASVAEDVKGATKARKAMLAAVAKLDEQRKVIRQSEKDRQAQIDHINDLKAKKAQREVELANDPGQQRHHLQEKVKLENQVSELKHQLSLSKSDIKLKHIEIENEQAKLLACQKALATIRESYLRFSEKTPDSKCFACGQTLPAEQVGELKAKHKTELAEIAKEGNTIKAKVKQTNDRIAALIDEKSDLIETADKLAIELEAAEQYQAERVAKLYALMETSPTTQPDTDKAWLAIEAEIIKAETDLGEPISDQLEAIDQQRTAKINEMAELNEILAQADRIKQDRERIKELEAAEKKLSQAIATIDGQLVQIDEYKAAESRLISEAVNGRFRHVEFKLFNELLNGSIEECCEATFDGVPYGDLSTGQQIFVGIDIINVLSEHYNLSVPLFVDHAESLTSPIEATGQVIELAAASSVPELTVELKKGELAHV